MSRNVVVVVVTYNSEAVIADCLASLRAALDGVDDATVVVVDNQSRDGTCSIVQRCDPHARLVRLVQNSGYAAGINAGFSVVPDAAAVVVLNPDVLLPSGFVASLLRVLELPDTGVVVPRVCGPAGELHLSLRRAPSVLRMFGEALVGGERAGRFASLGEIVSQPELYADPRIVDWASGCAMMVAGTCHRTLGGWDESFFLYSEETDFCLRARDHGFVVRYTPVVTVTHIGGHGERTPLRALMVANRAELFRRRSGPLRAGAFRAALSLHEVLRIRRGPHYRASVRALLSRRRPFPPGAFGSGELTV